MGFRSVIITEYTADVKFEKWFKDKYEDYFNINIGMLSSKFGVKAYSSLISDLPKDIQRSIEFDSFSMIKFNILYLHECGGVTKCQITKNDIKWYEPEFFHETHKIEHDYCYECDQH